jgi:hypothetical protein
LDENSPGWTWRGLGPVSIPWSPISNNVDEFARQIKLIFDLYY